jgi:NAD(P)-dependent dehydrogenase (short-subunit alcohol dehydrogenase family)
MAVGRAPEDVIAITGTGGMGIAIARRLGASRHIVLADYAQDSLDLVAETLRSEGHWVHTVALDVSILADVEEFARQAAQLGRIRAVIHTAGVSPVQATPARIVAVDVMGTAYVLDAFAGVAESGSTCVCIASMAAMLSAPLASDVEIALAYTPTADLQALPVLDPATMDPGSAYGIAKRANQLRVVGMANVWGEKGARVVSISPGIISTSMGQQELAGPSGDQMRFMIDASGTQRIGTPADIAAAVEFLVSPAASFITGTDLLVDGGAVAAVRRMMAAAPQ